MSMEIGRQISKRMTGSAASFSKCKLYVASLLASWREEKGLGVWGKGAQKFFRMEGWRMTETGSARLSESAMDVALFLASWREEKGLGVWGKGAPPFYRMEGWRMRGSAKTL